MFSLFKRKPPNDDEALGELSTAFFFNPEDPTFGSEVLSPTRLSFSQESLEHVNDYLEMIRQHPEVPAHAQQIVMRCGAYVGEVIRKHAELEYHWFSFDKAVKIAPAVAGYGRSLSTAAVLVAGPEMLVFPMARVAAFLSSGRSEDIHVFANQALAAAAARAAQSQART